MVKELSVITKIKKHTLDNYLNTKKTLPNVENAVKIARALGVSVEYLVTGSEEKKKKDFQLLPLEIQLLVDIAEKLNSVNRRLAIKMVKLLKEQEDEGKKRE
ncbi:MAG: helix-turn-helix domain-containing protein [Treponema sp.]|nr:helix-turn-helix domain-containing protein [Treponema sp.]